MVKKVVLTETQKELKHITSKHENEQYELLLLHQIKCVGLPTPTHHFKFHPDRAYVADICFVPMKWIIEVDGGIWMDKAGHTTGTGYERDRIRDAEAALLGYKTTRFTTGMVEDGTAINYIEKLFKGYL
jgi:very-short-patch-repair endonuclease